MKEILFIIPLLLLGIMSGNAQNILNKKTKDVAIELGINEDRASNAIKSLSYNEDLIKEVFKDASLKAEIKRDKIQHLLDERRRRTDSILSPDKAELLRIIYNRELEKLREGQPERHGYSNTNALSRRKIKPNQSDSLQKNNVKKN